VLESVNGSTEGIPAYLSLVFEDVIRKECTELPSVLFRPRSKRVILYNLYAWLQLPELIYLSFNLQNLCTRIHANTIVKYSTIRSSTEQNQSSDGLGIIWFTMATYKW
jgi:hypothetical protein